MYMITFTQNLWSKEETMMMYLLPPCTEKICLELQLMWTLTIYNLLTLASRLCSDRTSVTASASSNPSASSNLITASTSSNLLIEEGAQQVLRSHLPHAGKHLLWLWVIMGLSRVKDEALFLLLLGCWKKFQMHPFKFLSDRGHREVTSPRGNLPTQV